MRGGKNAALCDLQGAIQLVKDLWAHTNTFMGWVFLRISHLWRLLCAILTSSLPQRIPEGMLCRYLWFLMPCFKAAWSFQRHKLPILKELRIRLFQAQFRPCKRGTSRIVDIWGWEVLLQVLKKTSMNVIQPVNASASSHPKRIDRLSNIWIILRYQHHSCSIHNKLERIWTVAHLLLKDLNHQEDLTTQTD